MAGRGNFGIRVATGLACVLAATAGPSAAPYDFVPAPQTDLNRVYRIDRITGEVSSCQYGLQEGPGGVTLCSGGGEGGGAPRGWGGGEGPGGPPPGEYGLVAPRHEREGGVFRVNYRTGEMSVCYVYDEKVVCTPQASPAAAQGVGAAPAAAPVRGLQTRP